MTIALSPDIEALLNEEARRRGVNADALAKQYIVAGLLGAQSDALSRWEALNETDDPQEIARRQVEFEEFKEAMNRNRLEMEGPGARKVYP